MNPTHETCEQCDPVRSAETKCRHGDRGGPRSRLADTSAERSAGRLEEALFKVAGAGWTLRREALGTAVPEQREALDEVRALLVQAQDRLLELLGGPHRPS